MKNLPLAGFRPFFALILSITLFLGCRKDFDVTDNQTSAVEQSTLTFPVTIAEAKKWFEQSVKNRSIESPVLPDDLYPLWYMAEESRFQGSMDIVIVPVVPKDSLSDIAPGSGIRLVVFKNTNNEIDGCFAIFVSENSGSSFSGELSTSNFRGVFLTVSLTGCPISVAQVLNDTISGGSNNPDSIFSRIVADPNIWGADPGDGCFDNWGVNNGKFWETIKNVFSTIGGWFSQDGGSGSTGPIIIFPGGFGGPINIDYPGTETPPTGGGGNTLSQYFQNAIFGNTTVLSQPAQYPCRNQWLPGIDEPAGQSAAMPALLTAHPAGIGNFAMQWILLMATGNYNAPEDALVDIDWDEVGNSNTNDMMDGTPMNTALLQNVITMLNQAKAQGCGYTVEEAWNALKSGAAIQNLMEMAEEFDLIMPEIDWLWDNPDIVDQINHFVETNQLEHEESVNEAVTVHLNLLMNNPDYFELNQQASAWPGWMWEIFGEVLIEVGISIVQKQLGLTIGDDVKDAIRDCGSGDLLGCIGNTVDVLRRFFPALKFIDLALDLAENTGKATKVWKAIDKLQTLGEAALKNAWNVLQRSSLKVLDLVDPEQYLKYIDDLKGGSVIIK